MGIQIRFEVSDGGGIGPPQLIDLVTAMAP
jgi:hypothetical protein